jgi:hypothetical protein
MKTFDFYLDKKVTSWVREYHTIEANSVEEARELMKNSFLQNECMNSFKEQEFCIGTDNFLTPDENGGQPTLELYDWSTDELLIDNSPQNLIRITNI